MRAPLVSGAGVVTLSPYSLHVEVDSNGLDRSQVIADLATAGVAVHFLDDDTAYWRLVASVESEMAIAVASALLRRYFGFRLRRCVDRVLSVHRGGKIRTVATTRLDSSDDLAIAYTPGVGRVARLIASNPALTNELTGRSNTIAIVCDGTAVLGLGAVGPEAALPVMEGKAALFDRLAGINAVPLCLATTDPDEIVATVQAIAPSFGGINLEDIASPRCFEIEARLQATLSVPVFHDDQHGTAIVVSAALHNALAVVGKRLEDVSIVVSGAGAAGTAVTRFLLAKGARDLTVSVPTGVLHTGIASLLPAHKQWLAHHTNPRGVHGTIADAIAGADVFIGVSGPGALRPEHVDTMAGDAIVFALANPVPEIDPDTIRDRVAIVATGASNDPNQINNLLAFPGIFRGALHARARQITPAMKDAAADALRDLGSAQGRLLPDPLDPDVVPAVAQRVARAVGVNLLGPELQLLNPMASPRTRR